MLSLWVSIPTRFSFNNPVRSSDECNIARLTESCCNARLTTQKIATVPVAGLSAGCRPVRSCLAEPPGRCASRSSALPHQQPHVSKWKNGKTLRFRGHRGRRSFTRSCGFMAPPSEPLDSHRSHQVNVFVPNAFQCTNNPGFSRASFRKKRLARVLWD